MYLWSTVAYVKAAANNLALPTTLTSVSPLATRPLPAWMKKKYFMDEECDVSCSASLNIANRLCNSTAQVYFECSYFSRHRLLYHQVRFGYNNLQSMTSAKVSLLMLIMADILKPEMTALFLCGGGRSRAQGCRVAK